MSVSSISQLKYLEVAQLFHWATRDHYAIWFTGSDDRHHRTEVMLPRLSMKWANPKTRGRSLFSTRHGKHLVYTCPRRIRNPDCLRKIDHGLGVTECMVRLWRSNMNATVIEERLFYKCNSVPDVGIKYLSGKSILVEYTSQDNFYKSHNIKNKLTSYKKNLWVINDRFSTSSILLFVVDIPREKVQKFVWGNFPMDLPVFFVDFETFKSVSIGNQLSAPIYIWGEDGKSYPLTEDAQL